ncbi:hypothetical protein B0O80DRAFT_236026 [Mortierella sp. GBAus27b]|nr:hypothetical protein BGX31_007890 [Mortierella sp. GBA43]KAI8359704.1 hypothetical protein B0O80DRAFT_236026 [Mortierella sp. GBAus27b]
MATLLKVPSRSRPSIPSITPYALSHVFTIPELIERILRYSSRSDIAALRQTSWLLWNMCTNVSPCKWFYKDITFDPKYVTKEGGKIPGPYNIKKMIYSTSVCWDTNTGRFIRSLTMEMPKSAPPEVSACIWDCGGLALIQCLNISELSYTNIKVMMPRWEAIIMNDYITEAHATRIARQIRVAIHRLKKLHLAMEPHWTTQLSSSRPEIFLSDQQAFAKWIESVDRMLECIFLSTGYMANHPTTTTPVEHTFSCLQTLSLAGSMGGEIRTLEWDTLMDCLHCMPALRELELIRIQLVTDTVGRMININTIMDERRIYIYHDRNRKVGPTVWNLRNLKVTEPLDYEIISRLDRIFPKVEMLTVSSPEVVAATYKTLPPSSSGRGGGGGGGDPHITWQLSQPFRHLKRLELVNEDPLLDMDLARVVLPRSLVDLHIQHIGEFHLPADNVIKAETGLGLRRLYLDIDEGDWICQYMFSQDWCRTLTNLSLSNGAGVLRDLLLPSNNTEPWAYDHIDASFIISKLAFIPWLKSLHLGGRPIDVMSDTKVLFVNHLLRFMPRLEDFSMDEQVDWYQLLFYRLGESFQFLSNTTGPSPGVGSLGTPAAVAAAAATTPDRMSSRHPLRSIRLKLSPKMNVRLAEFDLRQQFPLLTEIVWDGNPLPNPPPPSTSHPTTLPRPPPPPVVPNP